MRVYAKDNSTLRHEIFEESGFWRWRIVDTNSNEFLDGGNYCTQEQAQSGLQSALSAFCIEKGIENETD